MSKRFSSARRHATHFALSFGLLLAQSLLTPLNVQAQVAYQNSYPAPHLQQPSGVVQATHHAALSPDYSRADLTHANIPWYQKLAATRNHDFGIVPTASQQQHVFEFENTTGADLVLTGIRTSCGCTKPSILTTIVSPGENARVKAVLDTLKFHGDRGATVSVSVKKMGPAVEWGELQFSVKGKIRKDVVLHPGDIQFHQLQGLRKTAVVDVSYAGSPTWEITSVQSTNPSITAVAIEVSRDVDRRLTKYQLHVSMDGQQAIGSFNDHLTIMTNDQRTSGMPVHVHGRIRRGIQVAPVRLGSIAQDRTVAKRLIVKSDVPVQVLGIETTDDRLHFDLPIGSKSTHVVRYRLDTARPGPLDAEVTLKTDCADQPEVLVSFSADVQAVPTDDSASAE